MAEINLMIKYPRAKRNLDERAMQKTEEDRAIARKFGKEFFDGERRHGYGGFSYHLKFWTEVVKDIIKHYKLAEKAKILDVGCAKGFMLHDFKKALPAAKVRGIDISDYAVKMGMKDVKPFLSVGNANDLSIFKDKEFDLVVSINTIHNLPPEECKRALMELERVGRNAFITVDAWRNDEEKEKMLKWNLTAKTLMHVDGWVKLFKEAGYTGDYYWFIP